MDTIKLGNEAKCIISVVNSPKVGDEEIAQQYQPFTTIEGGTVLSFKDRSVSATSFKNVYDFYQSIPDTIYFYNILITDKLLKLIYSKKETKLITKSYLLSSDDEGHIFLNESSETICYDIFIYQNGKMIKYIEELSDLLMIDIGISNEDFTVIYRIENEVYDLSSPNNIYLALDISSTANINDETQTIYMHLHKCGIKVNKNLSLRNKTNTVDLEFKILDNDNNYIAIY